MLYYIFNFILFFCEVFLKNIKELHQHDQHYTIKKIYICFKQFLHKLKIKFFFIFSDDDEPPTPEKAKAKVEEALLDLKDAAQEDNLLLN